MILALTNGLCMSLLALFAALFLRVAFRWREDVLSVPADPASVGNWWRFTWAIVALGVMPPTLAHMSYTAVPQFFDFPTRVALTLIGLVLLNIAGCLADMGFTLNRGAKLGAALPIWAIPVAFITYAMVTA